MCPASTPAEGDNLDEAEGSTTEEEAIAPRRRRKSGKGRLHAHRSNNIVAPDVIAAARNN